MDLVTKLEKKLGKYAVKNLIIYILIGYAVGYVLSVVAPQVYAYLTLNPYYIAKGQVWRIFTWILTSPQDLGLFTIFMFLFYYFIGKSLESAWGTFRYNLYMFSGILFTAVGAVITYFIMYAVDPELAMIISKNGALNASTYYINLTSFLAFALCFPDMEVMFFFIIPMKVKWLAVVDLVLIAIDALEVFSYKSTLTRVFIQYYSLSSADGATAANMYVCGNIILMLLPLLNFVLLWYFLKGFRNNPRQIKRRMEYRRTVNRAEAVNSNITKHKCAICGVTEKDGNHVFRFCSKCNGNYEYCEDHIFNHVHKE